MAFIFYLTKSKLNNYDMTLVSDDVLYGGNLGINIALKDIDGNLVSEKVKYLSLTVLISACLELVLS